jgi:chromate transporter
MNLLVLYFVLLKATLTSFTGPSSLPMVRQELVAQRHALTDAQLSASVAIGRSTPGPNGIYVVAVGYFVAGLPGAVAGWLAVITPALLILALLRIFGDRARHPSFRTVVDCLILTSVGLVISTIPRLASALGSSWLAYGCALASFLGLIVWRVHTGLVVAASAIVMAVAAAMFGPY